MTLEDLPHRFQKGGRTPAVLVKQFIGQAVELLGLENVLVRETIKDALGMELHPLLYPALFNHIDA